MTTYQSKVFETIFENKPNIWLVTHALFLGRSWRTGDSPSRWGQQRWKKWSSPSTARVFASPGQECFCIQTKKNADPANVENTISRSELIVHKAPIKEADRVMVPHALWSCLLYYSYSLVFAGHLEHRRLYDSMQRGFNGRIWQAMFTNQRADAVHARKIGRTKTKKTTTTVPRKLLALIYCYLHSCSTGPYSRW